jgi:hypothetical protein
MTMGYPMDWRRLRSRNGLGGDYANSMIAGDMQRVEDDTQDDLHLTAYSRASGATVEQVRAVFALFFGNKIVLEYTTYEERVVEADRRLRAGLIYCPSCQLPVGMHVTEGLIPYVETKEERPLDHDCVVCGRKKSA